LLERISHFRILGKLGEGGMGVVYKAEDETLRRLVALKVLRPAHVANRDWRERFLREAQSAGAVTHPGIATIYEIGEQGDVVFIAMEYVQGDTLHALMDKRTLAVPEILRIAGEIAEALERAHGAGVVHRDLKPDNILVQPDGHVKILDFGVAKRVPPPEGSDPTILSQLATTDRSLTGAGLVVGTVGYMSPEQARGERVDGRADLFALGVMIYEMASGRNPFRYQTAAETVTALLRDHPQTLGEVSPEAPPGLGVLVSGLLAKEPADRPGSAGDVARELRRLEREPGGGGAPEGERPEPGRRARSIAVLPFADMSAEKDQDYLCEGMAEELINALARVPGLSIAARTSAFQFKGKSENVRKIAQELNVEAVLEGSVRKSGPRLRVTAQLVSAADGYQLWSDRFDRELRDVFELQDEITATIVQALRIRLTAPGGVPKLRRHTRNLDAYHAYLKGRYAWFNRYEGGLQKAIFSFEQAIAADPVYALAHAGLADCYSVMGMYGFLPPKAAFARALEAAELALGLDEGLAEAHSARGFIHLYFDWDWSAAETEFLRALQLNTDDAQAWSRYALLLAYLQRHTEAANAARRAQERDPLSHYAHAIAGQVMKYAGRYEEASAASRRALELDGEFVLALFTLGQSETLLGRHDEGVAALTKAADLNRRDPFFLALLCWSLGAAGRGDDAAALRAEIVGRAERDHVAPFSMALAHLGCGDAERALEGLERSFEERDSFLGSLGVEGMFLSLRPHPRFAALMARLRLPPPARVEERPE
jgi:serine/threonine-protein kinase